MYDLCSPVVTARLDTFGVRFHYFSPYLFFQPTASLFFYPHVTYYFLVFVLCRAQNIKNEEVILVGVVTARLDTFVMRLIFSHIIYYIYFIFFISPVLLHDSSVLLFWELQCNRRVMQVVGVVTARLDTFVMRLVFSPILLYIIFIFFYIPRSHTIYMICVCVE